MKNKKKHHKRCKCSECVEVNINITINEGNKPMAASVIVQDQTSTDIPGVVSFDATTNTVIFTPTAPFAPSATITMQLTSDVKGVDGLNIAPVSLSFTTTVADTAPVVIVEVPDNNSVNVPLSSPIKIQFSAPIDPSTLSLT